MFFLGYLFDLGSINQLMSYYSIIRKGVISCNTNNDMIKDYEIKEFSCFHDIFCNGLISYRWIYFT
jgi:hypothetical protein